MAACPSAGNQCSVALLPCAADQSFKHNFDALGTELQLKTCSSSAPSAGAK